MKSPVLGLKNAQRFLPFFKLHFLNKVVKKEVPHFIEKAAVPVFNKYKKALLNNYRPSTIKQISKIVESIIHHHLSFYF
jgi:hypothetical protein